MKKILVDLNIILDFLNKRHDHTSAAHIYNLCKNKKIRGFICSHEITTLAYFLEKQRYLEATRKKIIINLLDTFSMISITETVLRNSLESRISDFEDAVIEQSALKEKIDCIISRDLKDFKNSQVPAYTATEYLSSIDEDTE